MIAAEDKVVVRWYDGSGHYGRSNGGSTGAEEEAVIISQAVGARDWATLVRGKDTSGHFLPAHVPKRDLEPEALAFHKEVSEEQVRVLYRGTGKTGYRA